MTEQARTDAPAADNSSVLVGEDAEDLDRELASRLSALGEPPHSSSECFESTRDVGLEAIVWIVIGATIWLLVVMAQ